MEDVFSVGSCMVVIEQLKGDPLYRQFLEADFDGKAVAAKAVQNLAITDNLAKIAAGVSLVEREIRHEVGEKYDELLSHATDMEGIEKSLEDTFSSVQALKVISERLQSRTNECYNKVEQHTVMLGRLHESCELARSTARLAGICRQLRAGGGGVKKDSRDSKDMIKSAQLLSEVDYLLANVGDGIQAVTVIRPHLTFLAELKVDLIRQCQCLLESGLETGNPAHMLISLQSLHNLSILKPQVDLLCEKYHAKALKKTREALDIHRLSQGDVSQRGGPGRAALGGGTNFTSNLWSSIEGLLSGISTYLSQVQALEVVMAKRRDANSHATFQQIYADCDKATLVDQMWKSMCSMLCQELVSASNASTFVRQAFEGEYPKLLKIFTSKLDSVDLNQLGLSQLENSYLSRSLSRLLDKANLCLTNTPPVQEDVDAVVNVIMSEMRVTESVGNSHLLSKICRNISKTIQHLCNRAEEAVIKANAPEAVQVIGPANATQKNNATALHLLHQFSVQVNSFLDSLTCDSSSISEMRSSLKHIESTFTSTLSPLVTSISTSIEAILLTMHGEKYDLPTKAKEVQPSLYMRELSGFMSRVNSDYLALVPHSDTVSSMVREMASRTVELFLRHVTLLRPLSDGGCLRLATDFALLETILSPFSPEQHQDSFNKRFKTLRAFRPLLLQPAEQLVTSSAVGEVVPYSLILHFLFARAPSEMKSPHEAASWSLHRYSTWLDGHPSEKDRLVLIRGTLDSYLRWVKLNNVKQFPKLYPVINDLLAKAVADCI